MSLSFRVGRADEPVVHGGMTHLAEHLILTAIDDVFDHANGTTEPYRVTFITRGSPSHVSTFLRDVCRSITTPRLSRMHQEANVLRTESAGKSGMGMSLRMTAMRTGYQGIGTCGLPEFFLDALDEGRLRAWIEQHFVAGNAVIWIAGDLPDDLIVDLPPGPRTAPPEVAFIDGLQTPTALMAEAPGVAAGFLVERTVATTAGLTGLQRQLTKRLRLDRGLGYEIGADYTPVSTDRAFASIWATCLPEAAPEVQKHLLETIDDVAARGPSPDELSRDYQDFLRELADPRSVPGRLDAHARNVLLGHDATPEPVATMIQKRWRLESEHVAAAWKVARDSIILLLPTTGVDPQRPLARYPGPATESDGGRPNVRAAAHDQAAVPAQRHRHRARSGPRRRGHRCQGRSAPQRGALDRCRRHRPRAGCAQHRSAATARCSRSSRATGATARGLSAISTATARPTCELTRSQAARLVCMFGYVEPRGPGVGAASSTASCSGSLAPGASPSAACWSSGT